MHLWIGNHIAAVPPTQIRFGDLPDVIACVNHIGIAGIYSNVATFAATYFAPLFLRAKGRIKTAGDGNGGIVLLGAVQAIRKLIVEGEAVKLRGWLVQLAAPGAACVEGDASPAIIALNQDVGIVWIDPQHVGIAMRNIDAGETFPPIDRLHEADVEVVNRIFVLGIGINPRIVPRTLANNMVATNAGERFSAILRAVQTAFAFVFGFDLNPNPGRFYGRNRNANAAYDPIGQSTSEFFPGITTIEAFPYAAFGTAVDECPRFALGSPESGVQNAWVGRIGHEFNRAGFIADVKAFFPGLASIFAAENAALSTGAKHIAQHRHGNPVRV